MAQHAMADDRKRAGRQPVASAGLKQETLDLLKDVGLAITSLLGKSCEVVIHDTSDLERSIAVSYTHLTLPTTPYV